MSPSSIEIACRRCEQRFFLNELLLTRSGVCPRCGWRLTEDWAPALIEAAARADAAHGHLVLALRRLRTLPGNVVPLPHQLVRSLIEEVGWSTELQDDDALHRAEREGLLDLQRAWAPAPSARVEPRRSWWSRAWSWLSPEDERLRTAPAARAAHARA